VNAHASVPGERAAARVTSPRTPVVRMQRALAATIVLTIGIALLAWYYLHLGDEAKTRAAGGAAGLRTAVASEMKLPALPAVHSTPPPPAVQPSAEGGTADVSDTPAAQGRAAPHSTRRAATAPKDPIGSDVSRVAQQAPVMVRPPAASAATPEYVAAALHDAASADYPADAARSGGNLGDALKPTRVQAAEAGVVASRRWLLPKGSFLDCTLETAIDSTFAALTTCVLASDVYGADGRVVLLERGTKLVGETHADVRAGQARLAVLWNEARTPSGVVVDLVSPGTDALGRGGLPGLIDRHTGERFGAAVLLSVLDAAVGDVAARQQGAGAIVYNAQSAHDVATEALRNTIAIPPTINVPPGARVMVSVVRDIDFRAVYRLVANDTR